MERREDRDALTNVPTRVQSRAHKRRPIANALWRLGHAPGPEEARALMPCQRAQRAARLLQRNGRDIGHISDSDMRCARIAVQSRLLGGRGQRKFRGERLPHGPCERPQLDALRKVADPLTIESHHHSCVRCRCVVLAAQVVDGQGPDPCGQPGKCSCSFHGLRSAYAI